MEMGVWCLSCDVLDARQATAVTKLGKAELDGAVPVENGLPLAYFS